MKARRVVLIGIDALDSVLLSKFEDELPNLKSLRKESPPFRLKSVFPPDTPTAWATIYTGLNPAKHGIVFFMDPLERVSTLATGEIDNTPIKGRTFWDHAGKYGKCVCVLWPQLGYPVWPINGVMVGRSTKWYSDGDAVEAYPRSLCEEYDLTSLASIRAVPDPKLLPHYIEEYRKLLVAELELGLRLYRRSPWDLFFMYSSALDWIGHNLWMYFDEQDPSYPGPNSFQDVFKEFYSMYDDMVGAFMNGMSSESVLIVMSDHGFGRRPCKLVNVNEILRRNGLLSTKQQRRDKVVCGLLERLKSKVVGYVNEHGAGNLSTWIIHNIPMTRRLLTTPLLINWEKSQAYVLDLSGIKAYTYGGIMINRNAMSDKHYEKTRSLIIQLLSNVRDPDTNENVFQWIRRREETYVGRHIKQYPDIVFDLSKDYGAGWAVNGDIFGGSNTHNIQSGSHRMDTPVFLMSNLEGRQPSRLNMSLEDVAPTVLSLMGVSEGFPGDGNSLFQGLSH